MSEVTIPAEDTKLIEEGNAVANGDENPTRALVGDLAAALSAAHLQIAAIGAARDEYHAMLVDADSMLGEKRAQVERMREALVTTQRAYTHADVVPQALEMISAALSQPPVPGAKPWQGPASELIGPSPKEYAEALTEELRAERDAATLKLGGVYEMVKAHHEAYPCKDLGGPCGLCVVLAEVSPPAGWLNEEQADALRAARDAAIKERDEARALQKADKEEFAAILDKVVRERDEEARLKRIAQLEFRNEKTQHDLLRRCIDSQNAAVVKYQDERAAALLERDRLREVAAKVRRHLEDITSNWDHDTKCPADGNDVEPCMTTCFHRPARAALALLEPAKGGGAR